MYNSMIRRLIKRNLVFVSLMLIATVMIYCGDYQREFNNGVVITSLMITIISILFMIIGDPYPMSLNKIFMLFSFFFYGIAPIIQYQNGTTLWGGPSFDGKDYLKLNVIIINILLLYQLFYSIFGKLRLTAFPPKKNTSISNKRILLISILGFLVTFAAYDFNASSLMLRSRTSILESGTLKLILSNFIRPIPAVCLLLFKAYDRKDKKVEAILMLSCILSNFPLGAPRYYVATIYIALMITYVKRFESDYLLLNKAVVGGLLILFPILDQARRITSISDLVFRLDFAMFNQGHFDSYQMFMRVISDDIITYGKQLLTTVLFFVPRALWPGKSVGSGHFVSGLSRLSFSNISMNFFGEGYINFGYFGIMLFILLIAYTNARLDKRFHLVRHQNKLFSCIYRLLLGLEFFILRGDLLSSFAYTLSLVCCTLFVHSCVSTENDVSTQSLPVVKKL